MATPTTDATLAIEAADAVNEALGLDETPGQPSEQVLSDRELDALGTHLDGIEDVGDGNLALAYAKIIRAGQQRSSQSNPEWT